MKLDINHVIAQYAVVNFNDAVIKYCIFADEDNSVVTVYKLNKEGRVVTELDNFVTEVLTGKVEISLVDNAPDWAKIEYERIRVGEQK